MMFCICAISATLSSRLGRFTPLRCALILVAVEIGCALLELAEILDGAKRTLRAMDLLVEQPTQARRVETEAVGLRTHIGRLMEGSIGVEIRVAIQASDAPALLRALAVLRLVELFLWEGRQQHAQPFELHRRYDPHHEGVVVADREQLALGDIAELGMGGKEDRRRKFGRKAVRQVEINVEAPKVAPLLSLDLSGFRRRGKPGRRLPA